MRHAILALGVVRVPTTGGTAQQVVSGFNIGGEITAYETGVVYANASKTYVIDNTTMLPMTTATLTPPVTTECVSYQGNVKDGHLYGFMYNSATHASSLYRFPLQ